MQTKLPTVRLTQLGSLLWQSQHLLLGGRRWRVRMASSGDGSFCAALRDEARPEPGAFRVEDDDPGGLSMGNRSIDLGLGRPVAVRE
jgi:hypothetical protein